MSRDRSNVTALLDDAPSYSRQNQGGIFVVIKGPNRGEAVRLTSDPVSFGSGPQCSGRRAARSYEARRAAANSMNRVPFPHDGRRAHVVLWEDAIDANRRA